MLLTAPSGWCDTDMDDQDPSKVSVVGCKRDRGDDVRRFLLSGMVAEGRAATSAAAVRSSKGQGGTKLAHKWIHQDTARNISQTCIEFTETFTPCVHGQTKDATRLGQPAKAIQLLFVWRGADAKSAWFLPQGDVCSSRGFLSQGDVQLER